MNLKTSNQYIPGVCNIGAAEIKKRKETALQESNGDNENQIPKNKQTKTKNNSPLSPSILKRYFPYYFFKIHVDTRLKYLLNDFVYIY